MNNKIGIHIRLIDTLTNIIEKAIRLNVPNFQTFFTYQNGKYIKPEHSDIKNFLILRQNFSTVYIHGSYWINLCSEESLSEQILKKEIFMAKRLEFTHIILHPGAAIGCKDKFEGINYLAKTLNKILKFENDVTLVLENTAHGNLSIGGDLNDFAVLLSKLDKPDKIAFCIDTAHAYSYGYDLSNENEQDNFIALIEQTIGKDKIALIHLNDTKENLGKKIDKHCITGEGNIGKELLIRFIKHHHFNTIPKLIELPLISEEDEIKKLEYINQWDI